MKQINRKKSTLVPMVVKLDEGKYVTEDLVDILSNVSFELININLSTKKTNIGANGVGYSSIGFVNGFDPEEKTFKVVVFENRIEAIKALGDVVLSVRAFTNRDGNITKIIGLDLVPVKTETE